MIERYHKYQDMFLKYYLHQLNLRVETLERQIIHKYLGAKKT